MNKRNEIIVGAARIFEAEGFRGVGVDRVIAPVGVSTRTLYKHFGTRDGLVIAVLEARHRAFMARLEEETTNADPIGSLFDTLQCWLEQHGARGCMLLRARSEYSEASPEIVALVSQQKGEFRDEIAKRVQRVLGYDDAHLSAQIWILFEGATAAASVASHALTNDARDAALLLVDIARARNG
ncbi:TetR/AcrR family transcriptional regulator [Pantoea alhagi]|uniref:TetR/AcrR family transcriptional regulator n=1 Tax=Pantoea alhagi TaxID=1891675 RepID=UPI00202B7BFD|nr:TetR/AcrR family transcriptional regulator [Pantoea alhagi]URQ62277.1 TetR/AcrR family transcriptional regulator [Pantoea alhagi]